MSECLHLMLLTCVVLLVWDCTLFHLISDKVRLKLQTCKKNACKIIITET